MELIPLFISLTVWGAAAVSLVILILTIIVFCPSPFNWRVFLLLTAGIIVAIVGMLIFRIATDSPPPPPKHDEESAEHSTQSEPEIDAQAVQEEAWRRIQPRLANADERTKK